MWLVDCTLGFLAELGAIVATGGNVSGGYWRGNGQTPKLHGIHEKVFLIYWKPEH